MLPKTVTIQEATTQLPALIAQAQSTQQPIILTAAETTHPIALLTSYPDDVSASPVSYRLTVITEMVTAWQQSLADQDGWPGYNQLLHRQLQLVAQELPDNSQPQAMILMLLRLAIRQMELPISSRQLDALQYGLGVLRNPEVTMTDVAQVDQILLDSGLVVQGNWGDEDLVANYVADL